MKKWIVATLMSTAMFASQIGAGQAQGAEAQELQEPKDETGSCRYTCSSNGRTYLTRSQCLSACGGGVCTIDVC